MIALFKKVDYKTSVVENKEPIEQQTADDLIDRLLKWEKDPHSDPELERMFQNQEEMPKYVSKEDIEFDRYYPIFKRAEELYKSKKLDEALSLYLEIQDRFTPRGTLYYSRPIDILERKGDYEKAINLCEKAIEAIQNKEFNADVSEFVSLTKRLEEKLEQYSSNIFESRIQALVDAIKVNPGINKKNLYEYLLKNEKWHYHEATFVIDAALESGVITREKKGRSFQHFVNQN